MKNIINRQSLSHSCIAALALGALFNAFLNDYSVKGNNATANIAEAYPIIHADSSFYRPPIGISKQVVMHIP